MTKSITYKSSKMTPFSKWIRKECKASEDGMIVSDLDYILMDYKLKRIKILEEKTSGATQVVFPQTRIINLIKLAVKKYVEEEMEGWVYEGFFVISFDKWYPLDSKDIRVNGLEVTADQLRRFIDFEITYQDLTKKEQ
ncbi:MAG: hypothetical protein KAS32_18750 [Candidatus Peribacteraceae bacterium]|nr:hypothetical protein [Candidatus Peribacteraceae bacterium]